MTIAVSDPPARTVADTPPVATSSAPPFWNRLDVVGFVAIPFIYCWCYGFTAFGDHDCGFLPALGWRILLGQEMYVDYFNLRPPLSPLLEAAVQSLLPTNYAILGGRFLFYFMFWISALCSISTLRRFFDFREIGISAGLCAAIGLVFSIANFAPYPWYTLHGVFFGSIGFFLLSRGSRDGHHLSWIAAGMATLGMAALTKQSFFPLPIVGVVLSGFLYGRRGAVVATLSLAVCLGSLLLYAQLSNPEQLRHAFAQLGMTGSLEAVLDAGLLEYLEAYIVIVPYLVAVWFVRRHASPRWVTWLPGIGFWGVMVFLMGLNIWRAVDVLAWSKARYHFSQTMFLFAVAAGVYLFRHDRRRGALLLALLSVAWCGGVSWGTQTPLLSFVPAIFGCVWVLRNCLDFRPSPHFYRALLVVFIGIYAALTQFPYGDNPRWDCHYDLGKVFPKLSGIRSGEFVYEEHVELRELAQRYGAPFTVLPALPHANYITDTHPPLPVDWALNVELLHRNYEAEVTAQLESIAPTVFVQRRHLDTLREGHRLGSWITQYVIDHWTLVEEHKQMLVYVQPPADSQPTNPAGQ